MDYRILGLSGSLRQGSYCTAVLKTILGAIEAVTTFFPLNDLPLYNGDLDVEPLPAPVKSLKEAIASHEGLIIVSPEYNYGISGVLKNALDWASRPGFQSVLKDKPVLIMTASPAFTGGARAQVQLLETLHGTLSKVVERPEIVIAGVHEKVQDGRLVDEKSLKFALEGVQDLLEVIRETKFIRDTEIPDEPF